MIFSSILILTFAASLGYYFLIKQRNKNAPPGPRGWPILGNALDIGKFPHIAFSKWAEKFGEIYELKLLTARIVILSDYKLIKEVYSQDIYTGRQKHMLFDNYEDGVEHGIVQSNGETWEQLRRFALRQLRDFGFGKTSMEHLIVEEVKEVIEWMKVHEGEAIGEIKERMSIAVVNSLWIMMSGQRSKQDDPSFLGMTLKKAFAEMAEKGGLLLFAPWLKHLAPKASGYTSLRNLFHELTTFFTKAKEEHKKDYSPDSNRHFIDAFLSEIKKTTNTKSVFFGELGEKQLVATVSDLFMAGSDTTSTTLDWAFLYLAAFPDVQEKFQKEIEKVTGNSRLVSLTDRPSMPYTEGVLSEILRCSSITPFGLPHTALVDGEIRGYSVPKDTIVMANIHYIHYNLKIWGDPENFRPERYLSPDGKTFKKPEALIAFSTGRRQCLGESLARDTLFLFLTNIFQRFTVSMKESSYPKNIKNVKCLEPEVGIQLTPKAYTVILKDREV